MMKIMHFDLRDLFLLTSALVVAACGNAVGDSRYCADDNRHLTDDELVERIMSRQIHSKIAGSGVPETWQGKDSGYESYEALLFAHPQCCSFDEISEADPPNFRSAKKHRGAVGYVTYQYNVEFADNGQMKTFQQGPARILVSACGEFVSK